MWYIYKLAKLKVPFVYLLMFFLKDRSCRISVNKIQSEIIEMYCGVQQGYVLGPLLFLAFFDIPLTNSKHVSSSVLFADDLGALFMFKKISNKLIKSVLEKFSLMVIQKEIEDECHQVLLHDFLW